MTGSKKTGVGGKIVPFKKKRGPVTVVDFDGFTVRVVQASPQGESARVNRVGSAKLEARTAPALKKALDALRVRTKEVIFALPRAQVVLRPLQVPKVGDLRELASVVNFQIAKDLPFRVEEAVVDFKVLRVIEGTPAEPADPKAPAADVPPQPEQKLEILVGAVKREVIQELQELAKGAGLKVRGIGLRSAGNARAARFLGGTPENAIAVVAGGSDETTFDVVTGDVLAFSRAAAGPQPEGGAEGEALDGYLNGLAVEVVRSLHSYEGLMLHRPVEKLVVAGLNHERIANVLRERLEFPVEALDAGALIQGEKIDRAEAAAAAGAIGLAYLALEAGGLALDFAHPKRPPVQRNTARTRALAAAAAAMVLLIALFAVRAHFVKKRMAIRNAVQEQVVEAEKKLPIYKRLKAQTKVVTAWTAEEQNWLDHLAYLTGILPAADQIYVSAINTTPQHVIRFSVQARSGELLAELDKNLRAAGYEVKPLSITPASDKYGYNFRTTVELSIPKKMKIDLSKVKPPARPADDSSLNARPQRSS